MINELSDGKRKITVASTTQVYPPVSGAHLRIYYLYKYLSKWFDIEAVSLDECGKKPRRIEICPGFWETSIPKTYEYANAKQYLYKNKYTLYNLHLLVPNYLEELERSSKSSDIVISSQPYSFQAIKEINAHRIWYDSHNVEYNLQLSLGDEAPCESFLSDLKKIEENCCKTSELIMPCSIEDKNILSKLYNINTNKFYVVPNGTDTDNIQCVLPDERYKFKAKSGLHRKLTAFFIGACWEPNIIAVEHIIKLAERLSDISFIISGYICDHFKNRTLPANVKLTGEVTSSQKKLLFSYADIGLNPMLLGSGTNIKMLEYFAYGLPVITTPLGARGLGIRNREHCFICEIDEFYNSIIAFKNYNLKEKNEMALKARRYVEAEFNWRVIAERTFNYVSNNNILKA